MTLEKILSMSSPQPNGCLLFAPDKYPHHRYGYVDIQCYRGGAHKAIWILIKGPVPEGLEVCHSCDHTRCININHLYLATHAQNMRDRDAKGRGQGGPNQPKIYRYRASNFNPMRHLTPSPLPCQAA